MYRYIYPKKKFLEMPASFFMAYNWLALCLTATLLLMPSRACVAPFAGTMPRSSHQQRCCPANATCPVARAMDADTCTCTPMATVCARRGQTLRVRGGGQLSCGPQPAQCAPCQHGGHALDLASCVCITPPSRCGVAASRPEGGVWWWTSSSSSSSSSQHSAHDEGPPLLFFICVLPHASASSSSSALPPPPSLPLAPMSLGAFV